MDFEGDFSKIYDHKVYRTGDIVRFLRLSRPTVEKMLRSGAIAGAKKIMYHETSKYGHWQIMGSDLKFFIREKMSGKGPYICL